MYNVTFLFKPDIYNPCHHAIHTLCIIYNIVMALLL